MATIALSVDQSKASDGTNEATLYISSPGGDKQLSVRYLKYIGAVGSDYVETAFDVEFQMVAVQGGVFLMGATEEQGDDAKDVEKPVHQVLFDGFYIGKYQVTEAQWQAVMGRRPYLGGDYPVDRVNWYDVIQFCEKLSQMTGKKYRLPTEAEWEYAARGGQQSNGTKYAGSNTVGDIAWYNGNSGNQTHPVGQKQPNELGLYDMSGNVWEWCSDWFWSYSSTPSVNPPGPSSGTHRMCRGGSVYGDVVDCRVSIRSAYKPEELYYGLGFRLVCEP